jgi:hypothetical protein
VRVEGYEVIEPETLDVARDVLDLTVRVRQRSTASLAGRVVRHGVGVPGATVAFTSPEPPFRHTINSEADGTFFLSPMRPGVQLIEVKAEGIPAAANRRIEIAAGEARTDFEIELGFTATVSGVVIDEGGKPQPEVYVRLVCDEKNDQGDATTSSEGRFRVLYLSGGCAYKAEVSASREAGSRLAAPPGVEAALIDVPSEDDHIEGVRLVISRATGRISGRVVDSTGAAVVDATVLASQGGYAAARTMTRGDGSFDVTDLPVGSYEVQAAPPGRSPVKVAHVASGRTDVVMTVPPEASLHGRCVGFSELPEFLLLRGDGGISRAEPGRDGSFAFDGLSAGVEVTVAAESGDTIASRTVRLVPGENAITLEPGPVARLEGVIVAEKSSPVAQVQCTLTILPEPVMPRFFSADAQGHFSVVAPVGAKVAIMCYSQAQSAPRAHWTDVVPPEGRSDLRLFF